MARLHSGVVFLWAFTVSPLLGLLGAAAASADTFDWRTFGGTYGFTTPVKDQGGMGSCWAFASVAALEAKYKLTRNDPMFSLDLSEQNLICDIYQAGAPPGASTSPFETGICAGAELAYTATTYSPDFPLQSGWQNRVVVCTTEMQTGMPADVASMKTELQTYGPLEIGVYSGDLNSPTLGTAAADHDVLAVGWVDDSSWAGGGYWIIKNSWGLAFPTNGFGEMAYANCTRQDAVQALEGVAYYTGTMYFSGTDETNPANYHTGTAAIATWTGSNNSTWSTGATGGWSIGGSAFTWVNQEVGAIFDTTTSHRTITISGTAIAHALTFNATGYSIGGGNLTVTAGGITANDSVSITSPITVGAPQTWTVASGQTLTVGAIHTVISDLTFAGSGATTISGAVNGGGVLNSFGTPAGRLIVDGPGTLSFTAAASCADNIIFNGGTLTMAMTGDAFTGGTTVNGGLLQLDASSVVSNGTLASSPLGSSGLTLNGGTLQDDGQGRTLATPVAISGNVTLASAGAAGLTFGPLGLTTPNVVTLSNSPVITVTAPTTIADQIVGGCGFTKSGSGVLSLTAPTNSYYAGPTAVNGGTLQGTAANIVTPVVLANGAAVCFNQLGGGTLTNAVTGAGSLVKAGSGTLDLAANNGYVGATSVNGGVLRLDPAQIPIFPTIWYDPSNPNAVLTSGGGVTELINLGSLGPLGNATVVSGRLAPSFSSANTAFPGRAGTGMPTVGFGYTGGDTLEGPSTNTATAGNGALMTFNGSTAFNNPGYTVLAVAARSFNNGALLPGGGNTATGCNFFLGSQFTGFNGGFSLGWVNTGGDATGAYYTDQYGNGLIGGTPASAGNPNMNTRGTEYPVVMTVELNPATGHSLSVNGAIVSQDTDTTPITTGASGWLGTGSNLPDVGYFNGDLGEVLIYPVALTAAQQQAVESYLQGKWLGTGSGASTLPPVYAAPGNILPATTPVTVSGGGTLDLNNANLPIVIGSLSSSDSTTRVLTDTGGTLTTGGDNTKTAFAGVISGGSQLVKTGSGSFTLSGSNTYTGGTTVEDGILVAANGANGSATGSGTVILSGGTLASGDDGGTISGEVEIESFPSEIAPGGIASVGTLTVGSLLTASNLTTLNFDLTTPHGSGDLLVVTGNLTLAADTAITFGANPTTPGDYPLIQYGTLTGSLSDFELPSSRYTLSTTVDSGYIDLVVAVPEPSTLVLLGVGGVGLLAYGRRRRRRPPIACASRPWSMSMARVAEQVGALCSAMKCLIGLLAVALVAWATSPARAASVPVTFIPAPDRIDMVEDCAQDVLYISSSDGNLLRYDLAGQSFLSPIAIGGRPYGVDISPDGNSLAVANMGYTTTTNWIDVVSPSDGSVRQISFSRSAENDCGTFSVAFADNGNVLVSSCDLYSTAATPLRLVNLSSGANATVGETPASTSLGAMLSPSADHSVIGIAENNIHPASPGCYNVSDGSVAFGPTNGNVLALYEVAVSRNGQQYALPTGNYNGHSPDGFTYFFNQNLQEIGAIAGPFTDDYALGIAYSPVADVGYIAWANAAGNHDEIEEFDTNTLSVIGVIDSSPAFTLPMNYYFPYESGRLRVSADGSELFALVNGGVNAYAIAVPEPSTAVLLGVGVVGLLGYRWRRKR
jgi:autotransporter-associated beta strand protein